MSREQLADPVDARANCVVGVVMDLDGGRSHDVVSDGLELLRNLEHRGTTGAEENTGDGAGIMLQTPHGFLADELAVDLPDVYAVGSLFLPRDDGECERLRELLASELAAHDLSVLTWRSVPTDPEGADLGETALEPEPDVWQVVVAPAAGQDEAAFDRDLYVGRRAVENAVEEQSPPGSGRFYVCSLDRRTLVYKGLLTAGQLPAYYPDLRDERLRSTFVMVHARFSTNTLGAWHLAHPYRNVVHNGEFNTIRGNVNWMRARENDLEHGELGDDLDTVRPVIDDPDQSDTASVDNALEQLVQGGRDPPHALRMLVPEAWRGEEHDVDEARRDFYDFHASLVEPWDGPALVCATEGGCYVNGRGGERFAVRNSGVLAVVEGIGDHGSEYMTGGAVAVLGDVGKNFAAGMSGGVAYVLGDAAEQVNRGMVTVEERLDDSDRRLLRRLVGNHAAATDSERARELLADWETALSQFTKVMPDAYRRAVEEEGREDVRDSPPASALAGDGTDAASFGVGD